MHRLSSALLLGGAVLLTSYISAPAAPTPAPVLASAEEIDAIAELAPQDTTGAGIPFGAVFWAVADEAAVPLLGLAKGPTGYPLSTHAYALASHLVYGLTAVLGRRAVRHVL